MNFLFDTNSPLVLGVKKLLVLLMTSFLWMLLSIPCVTIGVSTCALYDVVYKDVWHSRGIGFRDFFSAVRKNWRQTLPAGAVFAVLATLMLADLRFFRSSAEQGQLWGNLWIAVFILLLFLLAYFVWLMSYIARFEDPLRAALKKALLLCMTHLPVTVFVCVIVCAGVLSVWLWPGAIFVLPAVCMLCCCFLIDRVFRLYMTEEECLAEDEKNQSWRLYRKKEWRKSNERNDEGKGGGLKA